MGCGHMEHGPLLFDSVCGPVVASRSLIVGACMVDFYTDEDDKDTV